MIRLSVRYGVRALIIATFVPGQRGTPPLGGIVGLGVARLALYSALAALLSNASMVGGTASRSKAALTTVLQLSP